MRKRYVAALVAALAALIAAVTAPSAYADFSFCGPGITSGGVYPAPAGETCHNVSESPSNGLTIGNAEYVLAYGVTLATNGNDLNTESRARLGIPAGTNGFASPTVYSRSDDVHQVSALIDWDYPSVRKYCRWRAVMVGDDSHISEVRQLLALTCDSY